MPLSGHVYLALHLFLINWPAIAVWSLNKLTNLRGKLGQKMNLRKASICYHPFQPPVA